MTQNCGSLTVKVGSHLGSYNSGANTILVNHRCTTHEAFTQVTQHDTASTGWAKLSDTTLHFCL